MRYRLRTLLIAAMILPAAGPLRRPQSAPAPSRLKEWQNSEPPSEAVASPAADDYRNMFKDAHARQRVEDYLQYLNKQSKQFQLDPSYPLLYWP